jgi:putative membrane-bound dehydrogenase-like protein
MLKNISFLLLLLIAAACGDRKREERSSLYVPDDLEATLWAESPMFYNPTNIDVDYRGRIWVTEAVNYRNFNNDSTKALHHSKGDRVMILEDTDGDGQADNSKVFVQDKDLVAPLGIAVIGNKVYVSCSPNLIVYTDDDGDDRPDDKEILLTGFGGLDHDHSLHAVLGAMDGNLYFNTGNAGPHIVTDKSGWTLRSGSVYTGGTPYNTRNQGNMKSDDGKVWVGGLTLRMNPAGEQMRVMAHNFRNSYELAVDSRGDMWQNDNDDQVVACRTTWMMEGGNAGYFSADGTRSWQADQRPWQDVFTAHWHQDDPGVMPAGDNAGAGSPTGMVVNESDALGLSNRGMLLSADAGRNVIFSYHPKQTLSGYDLGARENLITSLRADNVGYVWNDSASNAQSDKWFRPSDVAIGTDGAIYVADWYDPVVGGHQMRDSMGYGRIYRIAPKNVKLSAPTIDINTVDGQLSALMSPAINVRATAMQRLAARGPEIIPNVKELLRDKNPYRHARAIWLLSRLGDEGLREVASMLDDPDAHTRLVAFRALRAAGQDILPYASKLSHDASSMVRRELIIALGALPFEKTKDILLTLTEGYDGQDRWYLEALGASLERHASELYSVILKRFNAASVGADQWDAKVESLVWRLHPPEAVRDLKVRASASLLPDKERSKAVTALAFINTPAAVKAMIDLSSDKNKVIADQATYWLAFREGNDWLALWDWRKTGIDLEHDRAVAAMKVKRNRILDPRMPLNEKSSNARDMSRDAVGAQMLLGMVSANQIPEELSSYVKTLLLGSHDPAVRMQAASYFKTDVDGKSYSIPSIVKLAADASKGKELFARNCATCHRIDGLGATIGPDLTGISGKFDRATLLDNIVNPGAGIVFGYEPWTIRLKDGQSFFGFMVADGSTRVTIRDLSGKDHVINTAQIAERKKQDGSLMPQPSALGLSEQDLADLSAYLMSVK